MTNCRAQQLGRFSAAESPSSDATLAKVSVPVEQSINLGGFSLAPGEGRRLELQVGVADITLGGNTYRSVQPSVPVRLDLSRTLGEGWAFRLAATVELEGPCTRCLAPAAPTLEVEAREVSRPGGGEELQSPYLAGDELDLGAWLRDTVVLALPASILCHSNCPGLCEVCGIRLAEAGPDHFHEKPPDPRWAALRDLAE